MSVPAAYLGVIIIWSTTPLAIQWSSEAGFQFAVSARMLIGMILCLAIMGAFSIPLPRHRQAWYAYTVAGAGIFGAMSCVYWASQFIPSGWISVIFGLSPIITGVLATILLDERAFSISKLAGMLLGMMGLLLIFADGAGVSHDAWKGVSGVLLSTFLHSLSAVWLKRVDAGLHPMALTGGGLLVAVPLFVISSLIFGAGLPDEIGKRAGLSIVYLGVVGSVLGFVMYFYVLQKMDATKIALLTLITPVLALLLGSILNDEVVTAHVWYGTAMILAGLLAFQGDRFVVRRSAMADAGEEA